jgi:hypothetical protein
MVPPERRGTAEAGEGRTTMRNRRVAAAALQQLHSLACCLPVRFSSARRNTTLPVHLIRTRRQTLLPVRRPQPIPAIPRPRAAVAPVNEAEEGDEEEEEAETEEVHHRQLLRPRIRELDKKRGTVLCCCTPSYLNRDRARSSTDGDADFCLGRSVLWHV